MSRVTGRVLVSTNTLVGCRRVAGGSSRVCGCGCGLMSRVRGYRHRRDVGSRRLSSEVLAPGIPEKPDRAAQCGHQASSLVEIGLLAVRRVIPGGRRGGLADSWRLGALARS